MLPQVMMVPLAAAGITQAVQWGAIENVERCTFNGDVYSMDVERYGHYVADGIVTHNCFYGWREGAAHKWYGPNNGLGTMVEVQNVGTRPLGYAFSVSSQATSK